MAKIIVQKFGGSSVADADKIRKVAARVKAVHDQGTQLVVVVSAMGDTTDDLLGLAKQISADPPRRELDMLLTCGERISMALLSMALHQLGVPAISFTGSQSGIITDDAHSQARIIEVRPARIEQELARGRVVIVAGYQGVSKSKEVTTLGRGGSDTTAVALAAALEADCEIYSDVDGVFSADPRIVPAATKLDSISFEEMQELAAAGAKVLNAQAVEFARAKNITIHAKSTHSQGSGTVIHNEKHTSSGVKGVTCETDLWAFHSTDAQLLMSVLDEHHVKGRMLMFDANGRAIAVVPLHDIHGPEVLRAKLPKTIDVMDDVGTVTCVGSGLNADWSLARRAVERAASTGAQVYGLTISALHLTLLARRSDVKALTQAFHQMFLEA